MDITTMVESWQIQIPGMTDTQRDTIARHIEVHVNGERERCAKIAKDHGEFCHTEARNGGSPQLWERGTGANYIAEKILSRSTTEG